jgi:hypothetical protein
MPNTTNGYPYPATSDPVAQGATAIQNLAQAIDTRVRATAAGQVAVSVNAAATGSATVTFPAGRFTATPQCFGNAQNSLYVASIGAGGRTATGCTVTIRHIDQAVTTATPNVDWLAIGPG